MAELSRAAERAQSDWSVSLAAIARTRLSLSFGGHTASQAFPRSVMQTNRDLYTFVRDLFPDGLRTPTRNLEEYLRALWALAQNWPDDIIPTGKLAEWFRDAFTAEVPPFDDAWRFTLGVLLGSNASCSKSRIFGAWQRLVRWRMNTGTSGSIRRQAFGGTTLIRAATSNVALSSEREKAATAISRLKLRWDVKKQDYTFADGTIPRIDRPGPYRRNIWQPDIPELNLTLTIERIARKNGRSFPIRLTGRSIAGAITGVDVRPCHREK